MNQDPGQDPIRDPVQDRRHWMAGIFYWNPDDPRDVVPRRGGHGTTFNFARVGPWLTLALLLAGPAVALAIILWANRR